MGTRAGPALAGVSAAVLFLGALAWAFGVFALAVNNFGEYCEDWAACTPGDPARVIAQAAMAAPGILALVGIGTRLVRYAVGRRPPDGSGRRAVVLLAALAGWIAIVWGMRPLI